MIDHNKDYFPEKMICLNGISIIKSQGIILSNNIIDGAEYGNHDSGGAVLVSESREITLTGCHIINPLFRGIQIERSEYVRVSGCLVKEDENKKRMLWGVELNGVCQGSVIKDNTFEKGKKGDILNSSSGAIIEYYITIVKKSTIIK